MEAKILKINVEKDVVERMTDTLHSGGVRLCFLCGQILKHFSTYAYCIKDKINIDYILIAFSYDS